MDAAAVTKIEPGGTEISVKGGLRGAVEQLTQGECFWSFFNMSEALRAILTHWHY